MSQEERESLKITVFLNANVIVHKNYVWSDNYRIQTHETHKNNEFFPHNKKNKIKWNKLLTKWSSLEVKQMSWSWSSVRLPIGWFQRWNTDSSDEYYLVVDNFYVFHCFGRRIFASGRRLYLFRVVEHGKKTVNAIARRERKNTERNTRQKRKKKIE